MKQPGEKIILAIETSCDETGVALLKASDEPDNPHFTILADNLYSQASKHAEFGGVYPNLAKREHGLNLVPLLKKTLEEAKLPPDNSQQATDNEQHSAECANVVGEKSRTSGAICRTPAGYGSAKH
jgi:hypothetical protein